MSHGEGERERQDELIGILLVSWFEDRDFEKRSKPDWAPSLLGAIRGKYFAQKRKCHAPSRLEL